MGFPHTQYQLHHQANQYDDHHPSHEIEWWKLHGNISQNGYENAIVGRYGGCTREASNGGR